MSDIIEETPSTDAVDASQKTQTEQKPPTPKKHQKELLATLSAAIDVDSNNINSVNDDQNDIDDIDIVTPTTHTKHTSELKIANPGSSNNTGFFQGYTILDDPFSEGGIGNNNNNNNNNKIPLPYKTDRGCAFFYKLYYYFETFIVVNPRFYALWLLYRSVFPRALVIVDMVCTINQFQHNLNVPKYVFSNVYNYLI